MADALIKRDLLQLCLDELLKLTEKHRNEPGAGLMVYAMDGAESAIKTLRDKLDHFPTVDAVPVVHGRWCMGGGYQVKAAIARPNAQTVDGGSSIARIARWTREITAPTAARR